MFETKCKKQEADSLQKLTIQHLEKHGLLNGIQEKTLYWSVGFLGNKWPVHINVSTIKNDLHCRLNYSVGDIFGDAKKLNCKIKLTTTKCHFSGVRYWFICPLKRNDISCEKRVGTLYFFNNDFACRHCHDLTYASKNKKPTPYDHLFKRLKGWLKIEDLLEEIKTPYYAGKPTKKYKRYKEMEKKMRALSDFTMKP